MTAEPIVEAAVEPVPPAAATTDSAVRRALDQPAFRRVLAGMLCSDIGVFAQSLVLGIYAFERSGSGLYVGAIAFAQLGPLLLAPLVGAELADRLDRKRVVFVGQSLQMVFSGVLAVLVATSEPPLGLFFFVVLAIGLVNACTFPALAATLPVMVDRRDIPGAAALQASALNLAKVLGPLVAAVVYPVLGAAGAFALNAVTYPPLIWAVLVSPFPRRVGGAVASGVGGRLAAVWRAAVSERMVTLALAALAVTAFLSMAFLPLFPVIAERQFGVATSSSSYAVLFALLSLGAAAGALSLPRICRTRALAGLGQLGQAGVFACVFGGLQLVLIEVNGAVPAALAITLVGAAYLLTLTRLQTIVQTEVSEENRAKVTALWLMTYGGLPPLGGVVMGAALPAVGTGGVLAIGGGVACAVGLVALRIERRDRQV